MHSDSDGDDSEFNGQHIQMMTTMKPRSSAIDCGASKRKESKSGTSDEDNRTSAGVVGEFFCVRC
jgi:hypothetical protein